MTETAAGFLRESAARHGRALAIVRGSDELDYASLGRDSHALARALIARGVAAGDRVGLFVGDGPNWLRAWAAIGRIGAVVVPMSTFSRDAELVRALAHPEVVAVLFERTIAGTDTVERFERALPALREQRSRRLALAEVPHLRWMACLDGHAPGWAWTCDELVVAAGAEVTDDVVHAAEQRVQPDDPLMMIYTSGSTAEPKGVVHSHRTVFDKARYVAWRTCFEVDERTYSPLPFFWVGGLVNNLLPTLVRGGTVFCLERFDATQVLELVATRRLTRLQVYPQHEAALAELAARADVDRTSLRWAPAALLARPLPEPPGGLFISLGMTETFGPYGWGRIDGAPSTLATYVPIDELEPGYDVKLVGAADAPVADGQPGEILVRGPTLTLGLHKRARRDVFDADGFYRTGDLCVRIEGRIHFKGRKGNMIKRAGANVAPREVEDLLVEVDGVEQAFVVGIDDEVRGQLIGAAVVPAAGAHLDPDELRRWIRERLSAFKVPDVIAVMTRGEIPRTDSQKVALGALAAELSARRRTTDAS